MKSILIPVSTFIAALSLLGVVYADAPAPKRGQGPLRGPVYDDDDRPSRDGD